LVDQAGFVLSPRYCTSGGLPAVTPTPAAGARPDLLGVSEYGELAVRGLGTIELNFYMRTGRDGMGSIVEDLTSPVDLDRDHWRGGERAAVTLVEYGDYECPYSGMAFRNIQRLEQQLAGQLRFVFRHLPLTGIHPHALAAAHFAEAAALQSRFWAMHELLFHRQKLLEDSQLLGCANQLGLDRNQLLADLNGQTVCSGSRPTSTVPWPAALVAPPRCSSTDDGTGLATTKRSWVRPWPPRSRSDDDGRLHPTGPDQAHRASRSRGGLRGVPCDRRLVGPPAHVPDLRQDRLLRLLPQPPRQRHARHDNHPVARSLEPSENWSWCYLDQVGFVLDTGD
jgi:hypothetical protein